MIAGEAAAAPSRKACEDKPVTASVSAEPSVIFVAGALASPMERRKRFGFDALIVEHCTQQAAEREHRRQKRLSQFLIQPSEKCKSSLFAITLHLKSEEAQRYGSKEPPRLVRGIDGFASTFLADP
jgi:hypothetical protein